MDPQTNQPYDRSKFLGDELPHTKHDLERTRFLLQALESFKNEPYLQEEIKELTDKVLSMEKMIKHTQEAGAVEREKAVKDAVTKAHEEDERILKQAIERAHVEDQSMFAKEVQAARKQGHDEGLRDEEIHEQASLHDVQEAVSHLHAMVKQAPKSMFGGFAKVKQDALMKALTEVKGKLDTLAPAPAETAKPVEAVKPQDALMPQK